MLLRKNGKWEIWCEGMEEKRAYDQRYEERVDERYGMRELKRVNEKRENIIDRGRKRESRETKDYIL